MTNTRITKLRGNNAPLSQLKWKKTMKVTLLSLAAAFSLLFAACNASVADTGISKLVTNVRAANERLHDVAVAVAEGYAPIPCANGTEGGSMGIHYVNANYLKDDAVDIARPEAVMYEPKADGSMELIAVEYITSKGPASLQGQLFSFTNAPNRYGLGPFYELHVWAWKANPHGNFADNNPNVSCDAAKVE